MNSEKILVVEDEWVVADQICRNLKDFGYTYSTASTAEEAVRKAQEERPDLILMDIVLKGEMDGIEVAERIALQFDIPVIFLTAYTNHEYIERAKQTKPFGYLVKPFNEKELYTNIDPCHRQGNGTSRLLGEGAWVGSIRLIGHSGIPFLSSRSLMK